MLPQAYYSVFKTQFKMKHVFNDPNDHNINSNYICAKMVRYTFTPEAGLLNKRLMLSLSSMCDQIYEYEFYDFGHTLLCY